MFVCTYLRCVHVRMYACMIGCVSVRMKKVYVDTCIYVCMYVCIYVFMHVCAEVSSLRPITFTGLYV